MNVASTSRLLHRSPVLTALLALALFALAIEPAAAARRRAFVTSVGGTADLGSWPEAGNAVGLAAGDAICQARAGIGGLPNPEDYVAWLSTATTDAYCRVQGRTGKRATGCGGGPLPGAGPWYLANGVSNFTADLDRLTLDAAEIYRPVILDEFGQEIWVARSYWTATREDGTTWDPLATCSDWTSSDPSDETAGGRSYMTTGGWTNWGDLACGEVARLLCLESGPSESRPFHWTPGSIVFTTSIEGNGNLSTWPHTPLAWGAAAGDLVCRHLAEEAHLPEPEMYFAWLSETWDDAGGRIHDGSGPFRRVDGYTVAGSKVDLLSGSPMNSLHVDEQGRYLASNRRVWTGTKADGSPQPYALRCSDWGNASAEVAGQTGMSGVGRDPAWTQYGVPPSCDHLASLYCFTNIVTLFWDGFELTGDLSRWSVQVP